MPSQGNFEVDGDGSERPLKLLQITDMHLFERAEDGLGGIVTGKSFDAVWRQAVSRHQDAELVLTTGDIAQESCLSVYQRAAARLRELSRTVLALPGNHDCVDTMFADGLWDNRAVPARHDCGQWSLILLNSAIAECVHGRLGDEQLDWLFSELTDIKKSQRYALICLHHHPVAMQSEWLDRLGLEDANRYWELVDQFSETVRGMLWGHVHQAYDGLRNSMKLMSTPSTGFQFSVKRDNFRLDDVNPGYRWLVLHPDGQIETQIERLEGNEFMPDVSFSGYK